MLKKEYQEIYDYCMQSAQTDCIALASEIMDFKDVPMHGPVHHFIVPAGLLTCYNNMYGDKESLKIQLEEAAKRAEIVPGANCAMCGACGAGLGVGQFVSIITQTTPLSEDSWSKVTNITALCGLEISKHGGPRCCKRDTYIAILTGVKEIEKQLNIKLNAKTPVCKYFSKNEQCRKLNCLFFPKKSTEIKK